MASHMARLATLGRAAALLLRSKQSGSCSRSLHVFRLLCSEDSTHKRKQDGDFFGIGEEEADVDRLESIESSALPMEELEKKYSFRRQSNRSKEYEQILETSFGQIRLDHARTTKRKDRLGLPMASQFAQNIEWRRQGSESGESEVKGRRSRKEKRKNENAEARKEADSADNAQSSPKVVGVHQDSDTSFSGAPGDSQVKQNISVNIFDEQYFGAISHADMRVHATDMQAVEERIHTSVREIPQKQANPVNHKEKEHSTHDTGSQNSTSYGSDFIDEQYFGKVQEKPSTRAYSDQSQDQNHVNIFEEQYFGNVNCTETNNSEKASHSSFGPDRQNQSMHEKPQSFTDSEQKYFSKCVSSDAASESARNFINMDVGSSSEPVFDVFVSDMLSPWGQPPAVAKTKPRNTDRSVGRVRGMQEPSIPQSVSQTGRGDKDAGKVQTARLMKESDVPRSVSDIRTATDMEAATNTSFATDTRVTADAKVATAATVAAAQAAATDDLDISTVGQITKRDRKESERAKVNTQRPQTAYEMAMKIRKDLKEKGRQQDASVDSDGETEVQAKFEGPVDSKGFRILTSQVSDLSDLPSAMVVSLLKDSVIYNKGDIVAIDKPYGLPSHDGPGQRLSVGRLLPELAQVLEHHHPSPALHLVHSLDRDCTGVLLLAKSEQMALQLTNMFRRQEVIRRFWVLTKGIPDPREGVIDIPIYEGKVNGVYRQALLPPFTKETKLVMQKSHRDALPAVTRYRVLDTNSSAALVLVQPLTGVKHQVRVHLAFGLNTPILGDHKYSHFSRIAPQKLFAETLQRLGIRQSKVRHLPMHLHAHSLVVPELLDGNNLFLTARLPRHFRTNMKRLKIKPPSGRQEFDT